jgi:methanethiol S-methyltransferase
MISRVYAFVAYLAFLGSSAWAVFFLAGGIDHGTERSTGTALAVDGALLLAFAAQHTIMARSGVKDRLTRLVPAKAERSTYVLAASLLLFAIVGFWQPVPATVWRGPSALWVLYAAGWLLVVWSTFMIDHADFLGLKQAPPVFAERSLYRWVRHPMMLGLLITFWATPHMTAGHLFFAAASTGYIAVGIRFEERDLRARLGEPYATYAARVPALIPFTRRARVSSSPSQPTRRYT